MPSTINLKGSASESLIDMKGFVTGLGFEKGLTFGDFGDGIVREGGFAFKPAPSGANAAAKGFAFAYDENPKTGGRIDA